MVGSKQKRRSFPAVYWSCMLQVLGKTNSAAKTVTHSDNIEPAALENESLDEERSDNIEPACELACESDSGEDERFQSTEEGVKKANTGEKPIGLKIKSRT